MPAALDDSALHSAAWAALHAGGLPSEAELASMDHATLYRMRAQATPAQSNALAPYEHRAFAREAVGENPIMAASLAVATPLYSAAKALKLVREKGQSPASLKEMKQAFIGIGEGLSK